VRQAVNYAIDKVAYRDAIAGRWAAIGELASTIMAPGSLGYRHYDLYPTPGGRGDPAKAKALLAQAGYPNGLTLRFATVGSGRYAAANKVIRDSLARAGIDPKVKTYDGPDLWEKSLQLPAKRLEHQLGQNGWIQVMPGDNARDTIVPRFDGRLLNPERNGNNFSEYNNPEVNRRIDRALAEHDPDRRAAIWAGIDQRIMRDAPIVPLIWQSYSFHWGFPGPRLGLRSLGVHARPHRRLAGPPEPLTAPSVQSGPAAEATAANRYQAACLQRTARVACDLDTAAP
jgi:peptide/nickel transport system substrate-binding protein